MTNLKALALTTAIVSLPALGYAAVSVGETLGTSEAEIRANLEAAGYTVTEFERENGEIEVEVMIDGVEQEIVVAANSGKILEIELEDDD